MIFGQLVKILNKIVPIWHISVTHLLQILFILGVIVKNSLIKSSLFLGRSFSLNTTRASPNSNIGIKSNYKRHDDPVDFSREVFIAEKGNEKRRRSLKSKKKKIEKEKERREQEREKEPLFHAIISRSAY